ncbi:MAG: hypothetical protein WCT31_00565 [Candidatus Micrarchaeia archaeon]
MLQHPAPSTRAYVLPPDADKTRRFCHRRTQFNPHKPTTECPHFYQECDLGTIKKTHHREIRRIVNEAAWEYLKGKKFADCALHEKAVVIAYALIDKRFFGFERVEAVKVPSDRCADMVYASPTDTKTTRMATDVELLWLFAGVFRAMGGQFSEKIDYKTTFLTCDPERGPFSFEHGKIMFVMQEPRD